jgi:ABC-type transport system involved in multi-copper enzyme maturation permease subunit
MKWLLWREYRLNRLILIAGGAFFVLPYAIVGLMVLVGWYRSYELAGHVHELASHLIGAWMTSTFAAQLVIALLAGNALAGERTDRSAEFVAYLPLSRRRIVASKVLITLLAFAPMWCVTRVVVDQVAPSSTPAYVLSDLRPFLANVLLIYGFGWLFSSCLTSVTAASVLGLSATALINFIYWLVICPQENWVEKLMRLLNDEARFGDAVFWYTVICIPIALISFGIGTWNYVRQSRL